jgi:hypothetical protein
MQPMLLLCCTLQVDTALTVALHALTVALHALLSGMQAGQGTTARPEGSSMEAPFTVASGPHHLRLVLHTSRWLPGVVRVGDSRKDCCTFLQPQSNPLTLLQRCQVSVYNRARATASTTRPTRSTKQHNNKRPTTAMAPVKIYGMSLSTCVRRVVSHQWSATDCQSEHALPITTIASSSNKLCLVLLFADLCSQ